MDIFVINYVLDVQEFKVLVLGGVIDITKLYLWLHPINLRDIYLEPTSNLEPIHINLAQ